MTHRIQFVILILLYCATTTLKAQYSNIPMQKITLLFAGDAMQHETQLRMAKIENGGYSFSSYYKHISPEIKEADIAVVNLETPIGEKGFSGYPSFCAPDSFLHAVVDAGFNVILLANNHILDRGNKGALYTIDRLDSLGTKYCGTYRNIEERDSLYPLIIEKKGVRIALLNYTYGINGRTAQPPLTVNLIDKEIITRDIEKAKSMNTDAIIACMHWGDEYLSLPPQRIKELSDWLLEQGVDHIIGNHPHVIQPIEIRNDKYTPDKHAVAYSLGNLVSNMSLRRTDGGIMLRMQLRRILNYTRLSSLQYILTWIAPRNSDGSRDFTILPAATTTITNGNCNAELRLKQFLNDSRTLLNTYNKGEIKEFYSDSVRITQ